MSAPGTRPRAGGPLLWRRPGSCSVPPSAPRLQAGPDARTSMTVSWSTFGPVEDPVLELADGEVLAATSRAVAGSPTVYHHATVRGPVADRLGRYRLAHRGAAGRPRGLDDPGRPPGHLRLTATGGGGLSAQALGLAALVSRLAPDLHLHAGDLDDRRAPPVAGPGHRDQHRWDLVLTAISTSLGDRAPWMPVAGDHEVEDGPGGPGYHGLLARFALPGNGAAGAPATWWMRLGDVAVVGLDSNDVATGPRSATHGYTCGAQGRWLDATLAEVRRDPAVAWVVAVLHHDPTGAGSGDEGVRTWAPILERHAVDLVISGHRPGHGRTRPLGASPAVDATGTVYASTGRSLLVVDVSPGPDAALVVRTLAADGTELDRCTLAPRDRVAG